MKSLLMALQRKSNDLLETSETSAIRPSLDLSEFPLAILISSIFFKTLCLVRFNFPWPKDSVSVL